MGTKVYFKSYSESVGYSMRDLNEDATSTWPLYNEDRTLNGQFCSGFTSSVNGYSEYDKELLKQTMLRHEEIFRKQVLELHRLYRIQRDLMVELQRKGEQISSVQAHSSQSSPFSTQKFSRGIKSFQEHEFSSLISIYRMATVSGVDNAATHLSSFNGTSFQCGPMSRENGGSQGVNQLLDSRAKKIPRRMIDLQLPAEAYIENDETVHADVKDVIKPSFVSTNLNERNYGPALENDINLTFDAVQNAGSEIIKSNSHVRNGFHPLRLADLNEPLKDASCKEMDVSSSRSQHWTTTCEGLEGHQKSMRSGSSFLGIQKGLFHSRYKGEAAESVSMDGYGQKCPFYNKEIGQSSNNANFLTSTPSRKDVHRSLEHGTLRPRNAYDCLSSFSPRPSETESWLREKPYQISDLSDISSYIVDAKDSGLNFHATSMPLSALSCTDYAKTASPLASSWGKSSNNINRSSIEIQAISCSSRSTPMNIHNRSLSTSLQNIGNAQEKWQNLHDFGSSTRSGHEKCTYLDGLHHGLLSESSASSHMSLSAFSYDKPTINNDANSLYEKSEYRGCRANLNLAPPNGSILVADGKESLSVGTSWLRTKSPSGEHIYINKGASQSKFHSIQDYSLMLSEYCTSTLEVDGKKEKEDNHADFMQDFSSNLKSMGAKSQQNEASVSSSCRRILGFPIPQCSNDNITSSSHQEMSLSYDVKMAVNDELLQADPPCLGKVLNPDKHIFGEKVPEKCVAKGFDSFKGAIDLNSRATSLDHINSPIVSSKDETELLSPVSVRGAATRFVLEIDLEVPVTSLSEEQIPSAESVSNGNQLVSLTELESKVEGQQVTDMGGDEILDRLAAETIRKISLDKSIHLEDTMCWSLPPASAEVLHWFADAVISNADDPENNLDTWRGDGNGDQESSYIDGMDYFEYMTLNLKETKEDDYCCRALERENAEEEESDMAHLLMPKPRRGQARKRRQRRDFQKDILPGLASLSRYEVTEDLQMIGGLIRASGQLWQPSGTRRNSGRNKSCGQPRRTRRQGTNTTDIATTVAAVPETTEDPQPMRLTGTNVKIDVRSIVGWGRTTRRCRRQRCSPGNILVSPPSS